MLQVSPRDAAAAAGKTTTAAGTEKDCSANVLAIEKIVTPKSFTFILSLFKPHQRNETNFSKTTTSTRNHSFLL